MHVNRRGASGREADRRLKAALYARYSSDNQREASNADQFEVCRRYCEQQGFEIVAVFDDAALSGSSTVLRPGYQRMVLAAETGAFDVVVCEAVDRLSRRLSDVAALHDRLAFRGVAIHAPSIGILTAMHVGIMGVMAQMQLADLGLKTKRGQAGRVRAGRIPAGLAYGYAVVPPPPGCKEAGERRIVEGEAAVVVRILRDYATGTAPRQIARRLNQEGVAGPGGRPWLDTTIRGQPERGTGILNNTLYIGELAWNRVSYVKNPASGRREARLNPTEEWEHQAVPELRIVDPVLWEAVRRRQAECALASNGAAGQARLNGTHRPKFVLSGLLRCSVCSGGYTIMAKDRYGCATHIKAGTCSNGNTITRLALERRVLDALRDKMMAPDAMAEFILAYNTEVAAVRAAQAHERVAQGAELIEVDRKISGLIDAIENGAWSSALQERLTALESDKRAIIATRSNEPEPTNVVEIRPATAATYRSQIVDLIAALSDPDNRDAASGALRSLVDKIVLVPDTAAPDRHRVELYGDLAVALKLGTPLTSKRSSLTTGAMHGSKVSVVAGTGFETCDLQVYEPDELPGCSTPRETWSLVLYILLLWMTWRRPTFPQLELQYHRRWRFSRSSSGWDRV